MAKKTEMQRRQELYSALCHHLTMLEALYAHPVRKLSEKETQTLRAFSTLHSFLLSENMPSQLSIKHLEQLDKFLVYLHKRHYRNADWYEEGANNKNELSNPLPMRLRNRPSLFLAYLGLGLATLAGPGLVAAAALWFAGSALAATAAIAGLAAVISGISLMGIADLVNTSIFSKFNAIINPFYADNPVQFYSSAGGAADLSYEPPKSKPSPYHHPNLSPSPKKKHELDEATVSETEDELDVLPKGAEGKQDLLEDDTVLPQSSRFSR